MKLQLLAASLLIGSALPGQTLPLDPLVVTAARTPEPASQVAFSVTELDSSALAAAPGITVDDALRSVPGFSLFRRDGSLTANPTTQGVSLRGLGPSGASRSLVLLDGIPLNDPFGGWITWSEIPREGLSSAEIVQGGGATAWGNSAEGGVIQLFTEPAEGEGARLVSTIGDFDTRSAELEATHSVGPGTLQLLGSAFSTDGYRLVAPENAGPIDVDAASRHSWIEARLREPLGPSIEATVSAKAFEEYRENGTPYQQNRTREEFTSLTLDGSTSGQFAWTAAASAQSGDFASTYSSVNAARTAETPAENQFAVPATSVGAAWTGTWRGSDGARTNAGVDLRDIRGETREDYSFSNGAYADQRFAGGRQDFAGLFALREQPLGPDLRLSVGARLDQWAETAGHLQESVLATGATLNNDTYPNRRGDEFSPSAGLTWQATHTWRFRADAQRAFRVPTLNELYRPFRQGANITEANPNLATEHATSAEAGVDAVWGNFQAGASAFGSELINAVDAITIATGPATVPGIGAIPAGGTGLERLNLGRVRVAGMEAYAEWRISPGLRLRADTLLDSTDIERAPVAPSLVGNRLVQVPLNSSSLAASWSTPGSFTVTPRVRWIGAQFVDDQNQLRLPAAVVVDFTLSHAVGSHAQAFLTAENVGDAEVETALSATGVVNVGTPRLVFCGLKWSL